MYRFLVHWHHRTEAPFKVEPTTFPYWINPKPLKINSYATCLFEIHLNVILIFHLMTTSVTSLILICGILVVYQITVYRVVINSHKHNLVVFMTAYHHSIYCNLSFRHSDQDFDKYLIFLVSSWFHLSLNGVSKGKAIPLETWTGQVSRRLRLPNFKTVGPWRW
jgi:hypothetical protein